MKFKFFSVIIALVFFSSISHAQTAQKQDSKAVTATPVATLVFEIFAPAPDSFFLVQRVTEIPTRENPRPKSTETSILFRSQAEWDAFLLKQKQKAEADMKTAKNLQTDSAERIESVEKLLKLKPSSGQKPN